MSKQKPDFFTRFSTNASTIIGRPWVFMVALGAVVFWALSGPLLGFSDTWQLLINTSTTVVTFLIVFVIQNTQNRDNMAINIKLDAIMEEFGINEEDLIEAEDESDKKLEKKKQQIQKRDKKK